MAGLALLPSARVQFEVARQALPPFRARFSRHQYTQPQF